MNTILTSVGMAILISFITFTNKMKNGESFNFSKLIRTAIIGLVIGVGSVIGGFEVTASNWETVMTSQVGLIAIADQITKIVIRFVIPAKV